jgi:hypothetical protein
VGHGTADAAGGDQVDGSKEYGIRVVAVRPGTGAERMCLGVDDVLLTWPAL